MGYVRPSTNRDVWVDYETHSKVVKTDDGATLYTDGGDPEEITTAEFRELVGLKPLTCATVQRNGNVCGRKLPCHRVGHRS